MPRVLQLTADGRASMQPALELATLRQGEAAFDHEVGAGDPVVVSADAGRMLDLCLRLTAPASGRAWVQVLAAPDGTEATEIGVDATTGEVYLSRDRASTSPGARGGTYAMPVPPDADGGWDLRILVDASIVEVFAADGSALTARVYPRSPHSVGLLVGMRGGAGPGRVEGLWWRCERRGGRPPRKPDFPQLQLQPEAPPGAQPP